MTAPYGQYHHRAFTRPLLALWLLLLLANSPAAAAHDGSDDGAYEDPRIQALAEALSRSDLEAAAALELELLAQALPVELANDETPTSEPEAPHPGSFFDIDLAPKPLPDFSLRPTTASELLRYLNTGLLTSHGLPAPTFPTQPTLELLGTEVPPGISMRLAWTPGVAFEGLETPTPVLVVNGTREGPTICLTAAVHGDELNGIEIVRRVMHGLEPEELSGAVIGVPIVNLQGFHRSSRYLPDRRDLNRHFPGNATGSAASRIAHSLLQDIIAHCSALIDLHTGSFHRTNLPQIRADLKRSDVLELTRGFGPLIVLQSPAAIGTLRRAATDAGVPTVTLEVGEPLRIQVEAVDQGVKSIAGLLHSKNMYLKREFWDEPQPIFYQSRWIRADHGGILLSEVELGDTIAKGHLLGTVIDPVSNAHSEIHSPVNGRVLGMALNQFVMPGYAAFRIGIETEVPHASHLPVPPDAPTIVADTGAFTDTAHAEEEPRADAAAETSPAVVEPAPAAADGSPAGDEPAAADTSPAADEPGSALTIQFLPDIEAEASE
jgi:uncharacterized protein